MEDLPGRLSATLNALLALRGMTGADLAERARMPRSQVSEYLSGSKLPKLPQLERLARALRVDLLTVFYTLSRIDDVRRQLEATDQPGEMRDEAGDVVLLREGGMLIQHPLSEVVDAMNRLDAYVRELQLSLGVLRAAQKQPREKRTAAEKEDS